MRRRSSMSAASALPTGARSVTTSSIELGQAAAAAAGDHGAEQRVAERGDEQLDAALVHLLHVDAVERRPGSRAPAPRSRRNAARTSSSERRSTATRPAAARCVTAALMPFSTTGRPIDLAARAAGRRVLARASPAATGSPAALQDRVAAVLGDDQRRAPLRDAAPSRRSSSSRAADRGGRADRPGVRDEPASVADAPRRAR